jgi:hypothetical protein
MQMPASNHHINDATPSAQPVWQSQTSLLPESTTWFSQPGPFTEAIQHAHVRTRAFRSVCQETAAQRLGFCDSSVIFGLPDWDEMFCWSPRDGALKVRANRDGGKSVKNGKSEVHPPPSAYGMGLARFDLIAS